MKSGTTNGEPAFRLVCARSPSGACAGWRQHLSYKHVKQMEYLILILIGLAGGLLSGLFGIGGGLVMVPLMVFFLHYGQKEAQGTSLALLTLPVAFVGAYQYYRAGYAQPRSALIMAVGFMLGVFVSSRLATALPAQLQLGQLVISSPSRRLFALLMIVMGFYILLKK